MAYLTYKDLDIDHSIRLDYIRGDILDKAWIKAFTKKYGLNEDEKHNLSQAMQSLDYLLNDGIYFKDAENLFYTAFINYDTDLSIPSTDKTKLAICEYLQADDFVRKYYYHNYKVAIDYLISKGVK